jgi:AcrR family transcriptional regulator
VKVKGDEISSAGCVYSYFKSKEDLVLAIAEERHHEEQQAISHASSGQDPIEGLRSIAQRFADSYLKEQGRERRHIAIQTWAEATQNRAILRAVIVGFEEPKMQIAKLIRRGQALGKLCCTADAEATARPNWNEWPLPHLRSFAAPPSLPPLR